MTVVIVVARPSVMIGDMVERYREGVCTFIVELELEYFLLVRLACLLSKIGRVSCSM